MRWMMLKMVLMMINDFKVGVYFTQVALYTRALITIAYNDAIYTLPWHSRMALKQRFEAKQCQRRLRATGRRSSGNEDSLLLRRLQAHPSAKKSDAFAKTKDMIPYLPNVSRFRNVYQPFLALLSGSQ